MGNDPRGEGDKMDAALQAPHVEAEWPQPDWQSEKRQPTRSLWRIAVMAGNLKPDKATRDRRTKADQSWGREYSMLVNAMKDALSSDPTHTEHIYFNPDHAGNADRLERPTRLLEVSVDMLSALLFIERRLGPEKMPAGMLEMLRFKQSNLPDAATTKTVKQKRDGSVALEPKKSRQDTGNETKAVMRLKALLFACLLWQETKSSDEGRDLELQKRVLKSLQSVIDEYGLHRAQGYGDDGFETLTKDWVEHFYQMLASRRPEKKRTHMGS